MSEQISNSARLTREAGIMAGRMAAFLAGSLPGAGAALGQGQQFLQALYESAAGAAPLSAWDPDPAQRRPAGVTHPLDRLAISLQLSALESNLLLLAGFSEEHEGLAAILRSLHPRGEPYASAGLAAQMFCRTPADRHAFRETLVSGPLLASGAVRLTGGGPLFECSLQPADSLWPVLHGIDAWPAAVTRLADNTPAWGLDEWLRSPMAQRAAMAIREQRRCTIVISGPEETACSRGLALVAHAGGAAAGVLISAPAPEHLESLLTVHVLARGVTPVLRMATTDTSQAAAAPDFSAYPGALVVCGRYSAGTARRERPLLTVPTEELAPVARQTIWASALPALATEAGYLAARFPVEPAVAATVAADLAVITHLEQRDLVTADVAASIRARGSQTLAPGVTLLRPRARWEQLVLAPSRLRLLQDAVARLEHQSRVFDEWGFLPGRSGVRGVRMLFTGPPGTGKTLSAEIIAGAVGVDLLVIDLSRVVSKWIGETEKNLAAVFDAAERSRAALFFDEADALFGKRTEVTDAHDRYANLETAYLLTRLEQMEGLAILATNLRQNIDPAFLRRLEFVVEFSEPGETERLALWRGHIPETAPREPDIDLGQLAALYPVSGGLIRNAAVAAAFLAAAEGAPISQRHLLLSVRREYEKAGRSFPGVPIGATLYQDKENPWLITS
ncbi:MAG: ATP-binding protein [Blastocatellia bacterium]